MKTKNVESWQRHKSGWWRGYTARGFLNFLLLPKNTQRRGCVSSSTCALLAVLIASLSLSLSFSDNTQRAEMEKFLAEQTCSTKAAAAEKDWKSEQRGWRERKKKFPRELFEQKYRQEAKNKKEKRPRLKMNGKHLEGKRWKRTIFFLFLLSLLFLFFEWEAGTERFLMVLRHWKVKDQRLLEVYWWSIIML